MVYGLIIAIICVVAILFFGFQLAEIAKKKYSSNKKLPFSIALAVLVLVLAVVPASFHQVNTGEVAVVRHLGEIRESKTAGVYFDLWIVNKYETYDAKVQQVKITTPAYSKDGQTLTLEVVIQYQIQPENVTRIATVYGGLNMLESRIETISIERIKSVLSEKTAMETIATRNVVSADVTERVSDAISEDYYVNINSVVLTNIDFTDEFERIVEEKVAAEQEAEKAKNEALKKETEAEAAKKVAQLDADAELYRAQKEAEAILLKAEAEAEALKVEKKAMSEAIQEYVDGLGISAEEATKLYEYIIWVQKWDGAVPTVTDGTSGYIILPQE